MHLLFSIPQWVLWLSSAHNTRKHFSALFEFYFENPFESILNWCLITFFCKQDWKKHKCVCVCLGVCQVHIVCLLPSSLLLSIKCVSVCECKSIRAYILNCRPCRCDCRWSILVSVERCCGENHSQYWWCLSFTFTAASMSNPTFLCLLSLLLFLFLFLVSILLFGLN